MLGERGRSRNGGGPGTMTQEVARSAAGGSQPRLGKAGGRAGRFFSAFLPVQAGLIGADPGL